MRYVAKILRTSLAEKFPRASEEEVDKVGTCAPTPRCEDEAAFPAELLLSCALGRGEPALLPLHEPGRGGP